MHLEKKIGGKFRGNFKSKQKNIGISFPASGGIYDRINPNADALRANSDKAQPCREPRVKGPEGQATGGRPPLRVIMAKSYLDCLSTRHPY